LENEGKTQARGLQQSYSSFKNSVAVSSLPFGPPGLKLKSTRSGYSISKNALVFHQSVIDQSGMNPSVYAMHIQIHVVSQDDLLPKEAIFYLTNPSRFTLTIRGNKISAIACEPNVGERKSVIVCLGWMNAVGVILSGVLDVDNEPLMRRIPTENCPLLVGSHNPRTWMIRAGNR
jgi:hypothetical protein